MKFRLLLTIAIDNVQAAEGNALVLLQTAVCLGDGVVGVGKNGDFHGAEAALLAWRVCPCQVRENRV